MILHQNYIGRDIDLLMFSVWRGEKDQRQRGGTALRGKDFLNLSSPDHKQGDDGDDGDGLIDNEHHLEKISETSIFQADEELAKVADRKTEVTTSYRLISQQICVFFQP